MLKKLSVLMLALIMVLTACAIGASAEDGKKVTITFWKWIPTETESQMPAIKAAFDAKYPGINLEVTHVGESDSFFQKLSAGLPAGEGPTVIAMQVGARANQYKEFMEPLAPWAEKELGANWRDLFLGAALDQCAYSGDELYVLPGGMTATPLIQYNAEMFAAAGIQSVPTTYDEMMDAIAKLSAKFPNSIPGVAIGAKEGWTCRDVFMGIMNQIAPGKIYEAQEGTAAFTEPEFIQAFTLWKKLFDDGFFAPGSLGVALYPDINEAFLLGGAGDSYSMISCGTWHGGALTKSGYDLGVSDGTRNVKDMGFMMMPAVVDGAEQSMQVTVDIAWGMNAEATDEEKEAAWKFIEFMTVGEGQTIWSNTLQVLPSAVGVDLSKANEDMIGDLQSQSLKVAETGIANGKYARELRYAGIANALNDALQAVAAGVMTPEQAAASVETASQAVDR